MTHSERIADLTTRFDEAKARLLARVKGATAEAVERTPASGGWSAAQVAWHVGVINEAFAGLIDGSIDRAKAAPEGFTETPWRELTPKVPDKLDAPARFQPPPVVTSREGIAKLDASAGRIRAALAGLSPDAATWVVPSMFGSITRYQVGEWAIAHVIRHNAQAKRALGA
jgi:hypothetical protein